MKICCPRCGQEYEVEETILGQNVECSICQKKFIAASTTEPKNTSIKKETPSQAGLHMVQGKYFDSY